MIISLPRFRVGQRVMVITIAQELCGTILNCKAGRDSKMDTLYEVLAENGARILATEGLIVPACEMRPSHTEPPEAA